MSRVGKRPIDVPQGVDCQINEGILKAKGKLGELSLVLPRELDVKLEANQLLVIPKNKLKETRMLWGTIRSRVDNLVKGVNEGFTRKLEINGVGYRAAVQGSDVVLQLGYSHEVRLKVPEGLTVKCESPTRVAISGIDRQRVGQFASEIRAKRPPEPYKGKGVRYEGEFILRKEGKKK